MRLPLNAQRWHHAAMMREWSDKDPEPLGPWDHVVGAIAILGSAGAIASLLLWLLG